MIKPFKNHRNHGESLLFAGSQKLLELAELRKEAAMASEKPSEHSDGAFVHVYTGSGKGKTTAALGLTLRALGAGSRVLFVQFIKSGSSSEIRALKRFEPAVEIRQYGKGRRRTARDPQKAAVLMQRGIDKIRETLDTDRFDLIVLDEILVAIDRGLLPLEALLALLAAPDCRAEWILTGRNAAPEIIERADLVTEMQEVKHYYHKGVPARRGIEF